MTRSPTLFHESLYGALKTMVLATMEHASLIPNKFGHSDLSWTKEFRTVRFGVGRRMGHTTLGIRLAEELCKKSIYLAPTRELMGTLQKSTKIWMSSVGSDLERLPEMGVELVVVDCTNFVSQKNLDKVFRIFSPVDPIIVLLQ